VSAARTCACRGSSSLSALTDAVAALERGELVVFPTEGLYGIGCDAGSARAVDHLVAVRGRDEGKPLLVLVRDVAMARTLVTAMPPAAERLARRFWPGPLTLVLPARAGLPAPLTAGTGTIGLRVPGHPVTNEMLVTLGRPVTAPSANPPGSEPPRTCAAARAYFGDRVATYVDGGTLSGTPSTVAALEGNACRVLRAGAIDEAALRAALEGSN